MKWSEPLRAELWLIVSRDIIIAEDRVSSLTLAQKLWTKEFHTRTEPQGPRAKGMKIRVSFLELSTHSTSFLCGGTTQHNTTGGTKVQNFRIKVCGGWLRFLFHLLKDDDVSFTD
jgi:hypothetical protein